MPTRGRARVNLTDLGILFGPASVAFVGLSDKPTDWASRMLPAALLDQGYKGHLYLVSRTVSEFRGMKTYRDIRDVPGSPELVISNVGASSTARVVYDCVAKQAKFIHVFTSGFSETGQETGRRLEEELLVLARRNGLRLVGPNCPGIYCPESGLSFSPGLPRQSGSVAWLAQSGGHCIRFVRQAVARGVRFSKAIGMGNACDLGPSEFLEYFAQDPGTRVVCAYVEGVRDGRRFMEAATRAAAAKPVILHKGGFTTAGSRAAASHTGSLAGTESVWWALCRQSRIIRVHSIDEMLDAVLPFVFLPRLAGTNVGVVGYGGGASVQAADDCERAGLSVPAFPAELCRHLSQFTPSANNSVKNPVDTQHFVFGSREWLDTVTLIDRWDGVDFFLFTIPIDMFPLHNEKDLLEAMVENVLLAKQVITKPAAVVLHSTTTPDLSPAVARAQERMGEAGLPVFPSLSRAASAIASFIEYGRARDSRVRDVGKELVQDVE